MYTRLIFLLFALSFTQSSYAFCGFYVGKADASLYNEASQVVIARKGDKTVLSLMNDYKGDLKDFALVVPVPEVLKEGQINIGDPKLFERIDAFTAPRLVEYQDANPCLDNYKKDRSASFKMRSPASEKESRDDGRLLGVTIEAEYTIGEYDIVILSAEESDGLETWLQQNGYKIPQGASRALRPYIKQDMKFFVAKVNLQEQNKTGLKFLRPLQFAFKSEKFMLPIRLGMINSQGAQDLLIYILTEKGRVETSNYRTLKLPSNMDIPVFVKNDFATFYKALFEHQVKKQNMRAVFTEYFWNMGWCDPCAANPLSQSELNQLGVFWLGGNSQRGRGIPVQVTRLHVRYNGNSFPEDLMFQETGDKQNYQGRYVLRHAWKGSPEKCAAASAYFDNLRQRHEQEARTLSDLTGWSMDEIRGKMNLSSSSKTRSIHNNSSSGDDEWWKKVWKK
ncbi:MAG: DUF2330 domain-containing protein [Methylococcaceae bacterium]|nr:DUF2330 domain-containing protein [Methylococcaceae bacterium]